MPDSRSGLEQEDIFDVCHDSASEYLHKFWLHLIEYCRNGKVLLCLGCIIECGNIVTPSFQDLADRSLQQWRQDVNTAYRITLKEAPKTYAVSSNQFSWDEFTVSQQIGECFVRDKKSFIDQRTCCLNVPGSKYLPSNIF